jgi:hypothetical protein
VGEIAVLVDLAIDRHRHPLVDPAAKAGEAPVELEDQAAILCQATDSSALNSSPLVSGSTRIAAATLTQPRRKLGRK